MLTLPDPKHEAFATLRASGHDLASAYVHAGYSVKNIKQRSRKLLKNPSINARIEHLKTCLPRIAELHDHHCPTLLLMPETRHEMLVWLWQVMSGARLVKPAQMRAAGLYCRLQGWHLAKLLPQAQSQAGCPTPDAADPPPIPSSTLTESEKFVLAVSNQENIAHEHTGKPRSPENLARYQSALANLAHPDSKKDSFGRPLPDLISKSTSESPQPTSPSPSLLPVRQVLPVRPVLSSPPDSTPTTLDCQTATLSPACGTDPASAGPSKNPPKSPPKSPTQPTLNQRLTPIPSPTPHFFFSSKADPASAGSPPLLPLSICSR